MLKRLLISLTTLLVITLCVFWSIFLVAYFLLAIIGVEPYEQVQTPSFHVRNYAPSKLFATFLPHGRVQYLCGLQGNATVFNQFTIQKNELCNIQQQTLPKMSNPVSITVQNIDQTSITYVTGCLKRQNSLVSCQKFKSNNHVPLFKHVNFNEIDYLQIQLSLQNPSISIQYPQIQFTQDLWILQKFVKDHYVVVGALGTFGIAGAIGLAFFIWGVGKIIGKQLNQQTDEDCSEQSINKIAEKYKYQRKDYNLSKQKKNIKEEKKIDQKVDNKPKQKQIQNKNDSKNKIKQEEPQKRVELKKQPETSLQIKKQV